jgi:hypothetical protein
MTKEIIQISYKERFKPASGISLFMDSGYCSQFRFTIMAISPE